MTQNQHNPQIRGKLDKCAQSQSATPTIPLPWYSGLGYGQHSAAEKAIGRCATGEAADPNSAAQQQHAGAMGVKGVLLPWSARLVDDSQAAEVDADCSPGVCRACERASRGHDLFCVESVSHRSMFGR